MTEKKLDPTGTVLHPKSLIAAVDDERDILELLEIHLQKAGFVVKTFEKAAPFIAFLKQHLPDLVVLDLMLPDADGMEVCKSLKREERTANIPVLILTARGDEVDVVLGLEFGADDYVVKPFSPKELVARVRAVLRRRQSAKTEKAPLEFGGIIKIDVERHAVTVEGRPAELTATEFAILLILTRRPGWVQSREKILAALWGDEKAVIDRTVDVHIRHLREKLGPAGAFIQSIRGVGYKFEE